MSCVNQKNPDGDLLMFFESNYQAFAKLAGWDPELVVSGKPIWNLIDFSYVRKINEGTVVTEEGWQHPGKHLVPKPKAAKIPNVCGDFQIPCIDLEEFMHQQGWTFWCPASKSSGRSCPFDQINTCCQRHEADYAEGIITVVDNLHGIVVFGQTGYACSPGLGLLDDLC